MRRWSCASARGRRRRPGGRERARLHRDGPMGCGSGRGRAQRPARPRRVGAGRERRPIADADDAESRREPDDAVAVTHPHLLAVAGTPQAVEQVALVGDLEESAPELAMVGALYLAAELGTESLLAIANAK